MVVQSLPKMGVTVNSLIDTLLVCCSVITVHSEDPDEPSTPEKSLNRHSRIFVLQ